MPSTDNATPASPPPAGPGGSTGERPAGERQPTSERPRRGLRYEDFTIGDLTAIRNLLRGGSVIDWHRLYFTERDEVDRFLRVNEMDPDRRKRHAAARASCARRRSNTSSATSAFRSPTRSPTVCRRVTCC